MTENKISASAYSEYFEWVEKNIHPDSALYQAAHGFLEAKRSLAEAPTSSNNAPFLSIVVRTQGKRPEMLEEVLLSLTGQSDTNFELLLMGHNLTESQHYSVSSLVAELPSWMQARTRLIPVNGGTRTTPLNCGFSAAKGTYIAVLDDDDLVFDNWVECFEKAAQTQLGKVLHAYSVFQDWETVGGKYPDTPRAAGTLQNMYCKDFIFTDQLNINYCPLCSLAFPASAYHELGIRFDETLTTTEDWDFLMRTAFICGVYNIQKVTFLYRNWVNAENSKTQHKEEEWNKNYTYIRKRLSKTPAVLTTEQLSSIIRPTSSDKQPLTVNTYISDLELYFDCGQDFNEVDKKLGQVNLDQSWPLLVNDFGAEPISAIRLDPCPNGGVTLGAFRAKILTKEGKELYYDLRDVDTNGVIINHHIVFLRSDPQIILRLPSPTAIDRVFFSYDFQPTISDEVIRMLTSRFPLLYRVRRKLRKLLRRKRA